MKKTFFAILTAICAFLLAVNFFRMIILNDFTATGRLSFSSFMSLVTSVDFAFDKLISALYTSLVDVVACIKDLAAPFNAFWTGDNIFEKIGSIFYAFYESFKGVILFIGKFFAGIGHTLAYLVDFLKAITTFLSSLLGLRIAEVA